MTEQSVARRQPLDNEELGVVFRRVIEIKRRIEEGTVEKRDALNALQRIAEGKIKEMISPCPRPHRSELRPFKRPSKRDRKRSLARVSMRLKPYLDRLGIYEKMRKEGFESPELSSNYPEQHPEDTMAQMWEARNIPISHINHGRVPVQYILDTDEPSVHDREIMATTLQWLMTNDGRDFLRQVIAATDIQV